GNWQRIFDFGNDTSQYLYLTPSSGGGTLRFAINSGSGEQIVERAAALPSGSWQHVAITLGGNIATLYLNGAQVASSSAFSILPSAFSPARNFLGKSQFSADPLFNGKLDAVEITDFAMTTNQISALYRSTQYPIYSGGVWTNMTDSVWTSTSNWSGGCVANGNGFIADFSTLDITSDRTVMLDSARTVGGLKFGDVAGAQNWTLSGAPPLTLDGGTGYAPTITVTRNTATLTTTLTGSNGFIKRGDGTLTLAGTNLLGGGLIVSGGSVSVAGGTTTFGSGTSTVGYLTGVGHLNVTGGNLAIGGELRIGGSDQNGPLFNAAGTANLSNTMMSVGSLSIARGNYRDNSVSGTVTLNSGSSLVSTNDVVLQFAGSGIGRLIMNGGNLVIGPGASKWLMIGYWDSGGGELAITNGNILLENSTSIKMCRSGNTGGNVVNQSGGAVTFFRDGGVTPGGTGNLDLNYAGGVFSSSIYNLNGGTLTVPQIIASSAAGTGILNFNGGRLQPTASNGSFISGLTRANVRNGGALIDTAGWTITIGQPLEHSNISGDAATDGGLTKTSPGILTLTGRNTYTGPTTISSGTLVLNGGGSFSNSASINLGTGTSFNVSGVAFTLGASQSLRGNGLVNGA
ncbi:MAG: LamG-like jellyroll fold domain-containing protein, partial [Verrucomicrobiota bacterium]